MERAKFNLEPCTPPSWARGGHAQTILGFLIPSPSLGEPGEVSEVILDDGDRLVTRFYPGESGTVVYLFHGLTGDANSSYMHRSAAVMRRLGHSVFLVNHRNCGEGAGKAIGIYHSGRGDDLSRVIALGRKRFPSRKHLAVGFSLSGNALLLLASLERGDVPPDGAIAVNAPIDLASASDYLRRGFNRVYDLHFVLNLRRSVKRELAIPWRASVRQFDDLYTAPKAGFRDSSEYYERCSSKPHLKRIKIPTVLLTAADDPFVPVADYRSAELSPSVHVHIETHGGHLGYLSNTGPRRWLDYALEKTCRSFFSNGW